MAVDLQIVDDGDKHRTYLALDPDTGRWFTFYVNKRELRSIVHAANERKQRRLEATN